MNKYEKTARLMSFIKSNNFQGSIQVTLSGQMSFTYLDDEIKTPKGKVDTQQQKKPVSRKTTPVAPKVSLTTQLPGWGTPLEKVKWGKSTASGKDWNNIILGSLRDKGIKDLESLLSMTEQQLAPILKGHTRIVVESLERANLHLARQLSTS